MDFRERTTVNEVPIRLNHYSELRHRELAKVEEQIDKIVEKNPDVRFTDLDKSIKADIWYKKAKILWEPEPEMGEDGVPVGLNKEFWDSKEQFFTIEFFKDPAFERSLLRKTQVFFLNQEMVL